MSDKFFNFNHSEIIQFLKSRFSLLEDMTDRDEIVASIEKSAEFKGANLWILILAILIASIGLNVNSTAVIIGAMLISPLMGPITSLGFGVAVMDTALIRMGSKSFLLSVATSLVTSTFYFWITPLGEAQSEILARISPTVWDVLIALCGGMAGIVGATRKSGNNVVPGVAIATALMPPLCTAGYGIATWQWNFFFGAFYLFIINSVFVAIGTLLVTRFLHFPKKVYLDSKRTKRIRYAIATLAFLTIAPSTYIASELIQKSIQKSHAIKFVDTIVKSDDSPVFSQRLYKKEKQSFLEIIVIGQEISQTKILEWEQKLPEYGLGDVKLKIIQPSVKAYGDQVLALKTGLLEEYHQKNKEIQDDLNRQIESLSQDLQNSKEEKILSREIFYELQALVPQMDQAAVSLGQTESETTLLEPTANPEKQSLKNKVLFIHLKLKNDPPSVEELKRIKKWTLARTGVSNVYLSFSVKK